MKHDATVGDCMELLEVQAREWGWRLGGEQIALLQRYAELLASYDAANVIGSRDIRKITLDHLVDSLSCIRADVSLEGEMIDVGAGGGLPGIPLAICQSGLDVTLLEATEKKVTFLEHARETLHLTNLEVLNTRAEEAGSDRGYRDRYDLAVARALASLPVVLEYCAPFVRPGGSILAMKGRIAKDELSAGTGAAARLGAELKDVVHVELGSELEQKQRHIVVFRKVGPTPGGYPRRVGLAKKRPLGS